MNHKLNKKKVAFVIIIAVLIISLGVFLFNNVNQSTKKETPKKVQEKTVQKEEKKKEEAEVNFTISFAGDCTLGNYVIAAIIKGACCFIGIDSGFAHFANCLDVYGILIFGKYKTFDYPMVYSGKYKDGSNATIIYADQKPAAEVEESKVLEVFMKHMYPEGRSIHSETGEEVKKPEIKIVTERSEEHTSELQSH